MSQNTAIASQNLPEFYIVIPARYASQRFPKKLLAPLAGKAVLQWVYELALKAQAKDVVIATDHEEIFSHVSAFGAQVVMTRDDHENGTERLAEVAQKMGWSDTEIVVNVQGDEPLLPIEIIHSAVAALANDDEADMATMACRIEQQDDFFNANVVKLVTDEKDHALYFSRAPIPWDRDGFNDTKQLNLEMPIYRHIGMYVYRARLLSQYSKMPISPLERWEKLEQLRLLHHGVKIKVAYAEGMPPHGVDTSEDLEKLNKLMAKT